MSNRLPAIQPPPIWARWVIAGLIAVALIVTIVIAVHRAGPENTNEAAVEGEANRIADIAITEDEAPHTATLPTGAVPTTALARAIGQDVRQRISSGQLTGPLESVSCKAGKAAAAATRLPYSCNVRSAGIPYTFLAVLEAPAKRLTWCKVDPGAVANAGPEVPISNRCKA